MTRPLATLLALALFVSACSGTPAESGLRDSFAEQLAANKFLSDFQRTGDAMTFKAPGPDGTPGSWRVTITSVKIEPQSNGKQPFKGSVVSSWSFNDQEIRISGSASNLPIELTSNGLGQECWALWDPAAQKWGWE